MPLESATYIDGLNAANPTHTDYVSQADSHIRLLKQTVKATFPNITAAVTATAAQLNAAATAGADITTLQGNRLHNTTDTLTGDLTITNDALVGRDVAATRHVTAGGNVTVTGGVSAASAAVAGLITTTDLDASGDITANTIAATSAAIGGTGTAERPYTSFQLGGATDQKTWSWGAQTDGSFAIRTADDTYANFATAFTARRGSGYTVGSLGLFTAGTERIRVDNTGRVGIGTTSPAYALDVVGSMHCTGNLTVDGVFTMTSMTITTLTSTTVNVVNVNASAGVSATGNISAGGNIAAVGYVQGAQIKAGASGIQFNDLTTMTTAATAYTPTGTLAAALEAKLPIGAGSFQVRAGSGTTDGSGNLTVTFSTAFPTACVAVIPSMSSPSNPNTEVWYTAKSASGCTIHCGSDSGNPRSGVDVDYIAVGY